MPEVHIGPTEGSGVVEFVTLREGAYGAAVWVVDEHGGKTSYYIPVYALVNALVGSKVRIRSFADSRYEIDVLELRKG